ncbi:MAG: tRNA adenosine(34) deaminase TadA [Bacteroidota bacterium]
MSLSLLLEPDKRWMKMALREAERAMEEKEIPVGAVVVHRGTLVGRGHNMVEQLNDPTAHAEMIAITAACETLGVKYLKECSLYVTLEPCPMCAGAMVWAKLERLVFGAFDSKAGGASTIYNIPQDHRLNHHVDIVSGVEAEPAASMLRSFFQQRRRQA